MSAEGGLRNECVLCMYPLLFGEEWPHCQRCSALMEKLRLYAENGDHKGFFEAAMEELTKPRIQ